MTHNNSTFINRLSEVTTPLNEVALRDSHKLSKIEVEKMLPKGITFQQTATQKKNINITFESKWNIVLIDGQYHQTLSTIPEGIHITNDQAKPQTIAEHISQSVSLPTTTITVDKNTLLEHPLCIHKIFSSTESTLATTSLKIEIGARANVTITEQTSTQKTPKSETTSVISSTTVHLKPSASCEHIILQEDSAIAMFHQQHVVQEQGSKYTSIEAISSSLFFRSEQKITAKEETTSTELFGLIRGTSSTHCSVTVQMHHKVPHTQSSQKYKYILHDQAQGFFHGNIQIDRNAQHSNATQLQQTILASETAQMETQPELNILADNVQCSHGATIGAVDEEQMFYLKSRGIEKQQAETILQEAFMNDILERISNNRVQQHARTIMSLKPTP